MHADDIILPATVDGLQKICDVCVKAASDLKLTFNCSKSVCIAFGPMCHVQSSVQYLGLTLFPVHVSR